MAYDASISVAIGLAIAVGLMAWQYIDLSARPNVSNTPQPSESAENKQHDEVKAS